MAAMPSYELLLMRRALELAARGPGWQPNPRSRLGRHRPDGRIGGRGFHRGAGTPMPRSRPSRRRASRPRGGTVVVTLEPCNHTGRTGPCAEALLAAGVARVVTPSPTRTPRPRAVRLGLPAAGVEVVGGLFADEAAASSTRRGRPRSPTGALGWSGSSRPPSTAAPPQQTAPVSGSPGRRPARRCAPAAGPGGRDPGGRRHRAADDPALTVRRPDGGLQERQPLRVVMGRRISRTRPGCSTTPRPLCSCGSATRLGRCSFWLTAASARSGWRADPPSQRRS